VARFAASRSDAPLHAVAIDRKRLLLAELDAATSDKLEPAFGRIDFDVLRAPTLRHARKVVQFSRFDLILIGFQPRLEEVDDLLAAIRRPGSPNATTRTALLAPPAELALARLSGQRAGAKALATSLAQLDLQEEVLDLLRSRARLAVRVLTSVAVRISGATPTRLLCQTSDLSRSGLFVVTQSRFPIGTSVLFTLDLPDGGAGIRGEAEVVRHAVEGRDRAEGIGLRFVRFAVDGERRLATFLERRLP
jgi:hypothetical protein